MSTRMRPPLLRLRTMSLINYRSYLLLISSPEEAAAATRIQAGYRGYKTRKTLKEDQAATKIQANVRGHQARKKLKEQEEQDAAATKIQAHYRGYRTRKEMKGGGGGGGGSSRLASPPSLSLFDALAVSYFRILGLCMMLHSRFMSFKAFSNALPSARQKMNQNVLSAIRSTSPVIWQRR